MGGGGDGEVGTGRGHGRGQGDGGDDPGWSHGASPRNERDTGWILAISLAWAGHELTTAEHRGQREPGSLRSGPGIETVALREARGVSATACVRSMSSGRPGSLILRASMLGRRALDQLGPNALGEVLEPGRVGDCYLGLLLPPGPAGEPQAGTLLILP